MANDTVSRIEALRTQIAQTQAQITQAERAAEEAAAELRTMGWDETESAEEFVKGLVAEAERAKQAEEAALIAAEQAVALLPKG